MIYLAKQITSNREGLSENKTKEEAKKQLEKITNNLIKVFSKYPEIKFAAGNIKETYWDNLPDENPFFDYRVTHKIKKTGKTSLTWNEIFSLINKEKTAYFSKK